MPSEKYDFKQAKFEMEYVIRSSQPEVDGNNLPGIKIPFNHPWLIAKGKHALVFKLPKSKVIGKSSFYLTRSPEKSSDNKGYYMLMGHFPVPNYVGLEKTIESLHDMGYDEDSQIFLPKMKEDSCQIIWWYPKGIYYTLMPDLREDGKYQLQDAEDFDFKSYDFGSNLRKLYDENREKILKACKSGSYELTCAGHGSEEDPKPAIEHLFLVQFNDKQGRLCIADLNHLIIKKL